MCSHALTRIDFVLRMIQYIIFVGSFACLKLKKRSRSKPLVCFDVAHVLAECVVLVVLLFCGRRPVTQRWFALWCSEVMLSVGLVCLLSGIGSDYFPSHNSPLLAAILPATIALGNEIKKPVRVCLRAH